MTAILRSTLAAMCVIGCGCSTRSNSDDGHVTDAGSATSTCTCADDGVCYEQVGGPAHAGSSSPPIECWPPSACPGGCADSCDEITGQGSCHPDATVQNLCICNNGAL